MYRYVALAWHPASGPDALAQESYKILGKQLPQWSVAYDVPGILVLHRDRGQNTSDVHALNGTNQRGVIVGQLFERDETDYSGARRLHFSSSQADAIIGSGGQRLIDRYWGSYLAILHEAANHRLHVLRDPLGTLPCYRLHHEGVEFFFAQLEDCLQLAPLALSVNRRHLTHWLLYSSVRTDDTAVAGVTHLSRGERLTLSPGGSSFTRVWDPTTFASTDPFERAEEASCALRATVQNAVDAWASRYRHIAHHISGGLDSSIVAACLAHAPSSPETIYFNLSIDTEQVSPQHHLAGVDAKAAAKLHALAHHGDERKYARQVAQRWNRPMIERQRRVDMDLHRLLDVPLGANPAMYFTTLEMDDADLELIADHATQAFFSGQAGDSVLLATTQPFGAIDHAYLHGMSRELWQQIVLSTALSKESLWSVLGQTVKHGLLRRPYVNASPLLERPTLLRQEHMNALNVADLDSGFARLAGRSTLPPGKRSHVRGTASAFYNFVFRAGLHADHIDPLNSQPVWETMLRVPTHIALLGGVSRGLARHAFADLLPPEIRKRQSKGFGNLFYQQLVRRNRHFLLEHLRDGLLVEQGYLDGAKLVSCLTAEEPSMTVPASILMAYLTAELWLRQVTAVRANARIDRPWQDRDPRRTAARN
jgi:asparagine synthase (glutamine-hydrolysing)